MSPPPPLVNFVPRLVFVSHGGRSVHCSIRTLQLESVIRSSYYRFLALPLSIQRGDQIAAVLEEERGGGGTEGIKGEFAPLPSTSFLLDSRIIVTHTILVQFQCLCLSGIIIISFEWAQKVFY